MMERQPHDALAARVLRALRDVPDFPRPGILFKDITPVLADASLIREVIDAMARRAAQRGITHVVGIESRGFLFGMPLALALGVPFVPVRKPGKLPWTTVRTTYELEYGSDVLEMHADAFASPVESTGRAPVPAIPSVLVVDDVLATGGTATAACELVERLGARVDSVVVLLELGELAGRARLGERTVHALCAA